jgi:hypothetical protein
VVVTFLTAFITVMDKKSIVYCVQVTSERGPPTYAGRGPPSSPPPAGGLHTPRPTPSPPFQTHSSQLPVPDSDLTRFIARVSPRAGFRNTLATLHFRLYARGPPCVSQGACSKFRPTVCPRVTRTRYAKRRYPPTNGYLNGGKLY